ncbi:MAG: DUF192 domain-containing protein [Pseudomonadota bacterium]
MKEIKFQDRLTLPIETALTFLQRVLGLAFRKDCDGRGLLIALPKRSNPKIWMWGMRFAIDILWIRDDEVVKVEEDVARPKNCFLSVIFPYCLKKYSAGKDVDYILEVEAGFCRKNNISAREKICLNI